MYQSNLSQHSSCHCSQAVKAVKLSRQSICQGSQDTKAVKLSRQSICQRSKNVKAVKLSGQSVKLSKQTIASIVHICTCLIVCSSQILDSCFLHREGTIKKARCPNVPLVQDWLSLVSWEWPELVHILGCEYNKEDHRWQPMGSSDWSIPRHVTWSSLLTCAGNRLIGEVVQSQRRPLLGPSPG